MSLLRQVARNTGLQFAGKLIGTLLGFWVAAVLFRYLKDELYGNYTTAMVYLQLFGIIMDLGLYVVLLKHIGSPENRDHTITNNTFAFRTITAFVLLLIACAGVWLIPQYPLIVKWAVVVLAANFFFITINQLFQAVFQHHFAMGWVALAEVISKLVLVVSTFYVVYIQQGGLLGIMASVVLAGGTQTLILYLASRYYEHIRFAFNFKIWKQLLKERWPIAIAIALNLVYFKSDTIILSIFHSQATVGIYGVPYKMLEVLITLPAMVVGLLLPVLSQQIQLKQFEQFKNLYQRAFNLLWILGAPIIAGSWFIAEPLMVLIAGPDFTGDPAVLGQLFRVLVFAIASIYLGTLTGYVVVAINQQKTIILGYMFVAVTALVGYFWLIPQYSYFGAAAVTVYSEIAMVLIATGVIYRHTQVGPNLFGLLRITLAAVVMAVIVSLIDSWPVWFVVPIGGVVYGLVLLAVKGITTQELKAVLWRNQAS